jgi:hypoxanthine phosphoribosyltransferase
VQKQFIDEEELLIDAYRLGVDVYESGFRPTFIVGIWRGGSPVGIAVQECLQYLGVETDHISIRTSYRGMTSYKAMLENASAIRVHSTRYLLENLDADDDLLIVDDVYSSGLNIKAVIDRLSQRTRRNMPRDVRVAVPWYRPSSNRTDRAPDYYLHKTDKWLVLPWELDGLTREEIYRDKAFLKPIFEEVSGDDGKGS